MPKITSGGVTNQIVDPDYVAPSGTPVEDAMDRGIPDQGQRSDDQPDTEREDRDEGNNPERDERRTTDADRDTGRENDDRDSGRGPKPANETPAVDAPKKDTPAGKAAPAKKTTPAKIK